MVIARWRITGNKRPVFRRIVHRWQADCGYREFLAIALPLILSTASWSIQLFIDRIFLSWHSTDSLAASMPAGMTSFAFSCIFLGVARYINTFVAQYQGANRPNRIGPSVWQGLYLAIASGFYGWFLSTQSEGLFTWIGHEPAVRAEEITYFGILCFGIAPSVFSTALSCFYSGRGRTWTIFGVNLVGMGVNIGLDYCLIFGNCGFPQMGIAGAAWATICAALVNALLYVFLITRKPYRERYGTVRGWKPDTELLHRLIRYGGPDGLTFMLDILAFTSFILLVGRLGTVELAATNMAFNVNSLAFMPLIGAGIAVTTMVGQRLGRNLPERAEYATWSGLHLAVFYMGTMALAYILIPQLFLTPYQVNAEGEEFEAAQAIAKVLLRFVAIYCIFDALYMIFTAALKGAGDTRFILAVSITLGWAIMVCPTFLWIRYGGGDLYVPWMFVCAFIAAVGIVFYLRFRGGKWKGMRVIENLSVLPVECPTNPQETGLIPGSSDGTFVDERES